VIRLFDVISLLSGKLPCLGGEVRMSVIDSTGKIEISVRNPGSLIPSQVQAQIMELHRGSVHVSSDIATGTDFKLVFPT
jgi:signal transduction histidine kinase